MDNDDIVFNKIKNKINIEKNIGGENIKKIIYNSVHT
jgi:hypothetical protein